MALCPSCRAENPDGTKICVKCGTELPKADGAGHRVAAGPGDVSTPGMGVKDMGKDFVDIVWLLVIIALIIIGFLGEATQWTFNFTQKEAAKTITPSLEIKKVVPQKIQRVAVIPRSQTKAPVQPQVQSEVQPPIQVQAPSAPIGEKPAVQFGTAESFYYKAKGQSDRQHYRASYHTLKQALEIDPTFSMAYFGLGYIFSHFDMNDPAVRMYEMSLRFDPNHVDSMNNLGMMFYHAGNWDDAQFLFEKAVSLAPQNADYVYNLGSLYYDKNQPEYALLAFQRAASLRSNDAAIYNNMALTYEKLGKKSEAQDSWQKVLQYSESAEYIESAKVHLDSLQRQN
jgi:Flp pilus assembly protein TadD